MRSFGCWLVLIHSICILKQNLMVSRQFIDSVLRADRTIIINNDIDRMILSSQWQSVAVSGSCWGLGAGLVTPECGTVATVIRGLGMAPKLEKPSNAPLSSNGYYFGNKESLRISHFPGYSSTSDLSCGASGNQYNINASIHARSPSTTGAASSPVFDISLDSAAQRLCCQTLRHGLLLLRCESGEIPCCDCSPN